MDSPYFILLDIDQKPPLPPETAAAAPPPEVLEEAEIPEPGLPDFALLRNLGWLRRLVRCGNASLVLLCSAHSNC